MSREVEGVNLDDLEEQYQAFETAVIAAMSRAIRMAMRDDAVAPSLARLSLDDLNVIPGAWAAQVPGLAEQIVEAYVAAANMQAAAYEKSGRARLPLFDSEHQAAIDYLSQASNRLVGIGDELWTDARNELLAGLDLGEDIPTITTRVRKTVEVTEPRARAIARTETISASNAGSIAFMRSTGQVATKAWLSHLDGRTRPEHAAADGQEVDLGSKFMVGGYPMDHPGDPGAPAHLVAQCRCTMKFGLTVEADDLAQDGDTLAASATEETAMTELDETAALVAAMTDAPTVEWEGIVCIEGEVTGDHRMFEGMTWAALPMPLRWNIVESHGGIPQTQAVLIGRCDSLERRGNEIWGRGVINVGSVTGAQAAAQMGTMDAPGFLSGISVDADDPTNGLVEVIFPAGCSDTDPASMSPDDQARCMEPERVVYHDARIRAMTLTDIPAFARAQVYLTDSVSPSMNPTEDGAMDFGTQELVSDGFILADVVESLTAAAHSVTLDDVPPRWFFDEPESMPEIGGISVTADGRFFGYVAPVNVAHRGIEKRTTVPLRNVDYSRWMTRPRAVTGEDGTVTHIATGPITMDCNHADTRTNSGAIAREHYENSCSIVATACIGENSNGVWIAGALMPDITAAQVARILACQLSGDWRAHKELPGKREFAGALLVSVPGFPIANRGPKVSFRGDALVASAVPVSFASDVDSADCGCSSADYADTANAARLIAASVGRDKVTRARDLYQSVRG